MIVIYTALFGSYDRLPEVPHYSGITKYVCFTDVIPEEANGWEFELVETEFEPIKANRWYKFHPHLLFPEHIFSIYVDANIKIIGNLQDFISYYNNPILAVPRHKYRDCLYQEIDQCLKIGKISLLESEEIKKRYKDSGFPRNFGLAEMSVIIRRHHNSKVIKTMIDWWEEFNKLGKRDQLSFMFVAWKNGLDVNFMKENMQKVNPYFYRLPHASEKMKIRTKVRNIISRLLAKVY